MHELQAGPDEPDEGGRSGARGADSGGGDTGAIRQRVEPRSRAEYAADLEQRVSGAWAEHTFRPPDGGGADSSDGTLDGSGADRRDAPAEVLGRFEPRRAGLPEISARDAVAYIEAHHAERPWLAAARGCPPDVQRVFAALDQGGGHTHIRHEGWVSEEMNRRRVAYLEDPAQLDPAKRAAGIDGLLPGDQFHKCGRTATRIADPDAFAVAIACAAEHPDVRTALDMRFQAKHAPAQVILPIAELLGSDGHRHCTGWQLDVTGGSLKAAREQRDSGSGWRTRMLMRLNRGPGR